MKGAVRPLPSNRQGSSSSWDALSEGASEGAEIPKLRFSQWFWVLKGAVVR